MIPVTIIGSCRVYEPLLQAGVPMNQAHVYGYTHNTREHLQMLRLGRIGSPPSEAIARMSCIARGYAGFPEIVTRDRFYVLEICSIRVVEYLGWYLQINRFFTYCSEFTPSAVNAVTFSSEVALKKVLHACQDLPVDVDALQYYEQSEEELMADLLELHRLLEGRVLFVSHFNTDKQGKQVWQRQRIVDCLARLHAGSGAHVFDPTAAMKQYGPERAMVNMGHYTPEFQAIIAQLLSDRIGAIVAALDA